MGNKESVVGGGGGGWTAGAVDATPRVRSPKSHATFGFAVGCWQGQCKGPVLDEFVQDEPV